MVGSTIAGAHSLTLLEDLCHLWIKLNVLLSLFFYLLVSFLYSFIHPLLELVSKPSVQNVNKIGSPHLNHLLLSIWEAHFEKGVVLDELGEVFESQVLVAGDVHGLDVLAPDAFLDTGGKITHMPRGDLIHAG